MGCKERLRGTILGKGKVLSGAKTDRTRSVHPHTRIPVPLPLSSNLVRPLALPSEVPANHIIVPFPFPKLAPLLSLVNLPPPDPCSYAFQIPPLPSLSHSFAPFTRAFLLLFKDFSVSPHFPAPATCPLSLHFSCCHFVQLTGSVPQFDQLEGVGLFNLLFYPCFGPFLLLLLYLVRISSISSSIFPSTFACNSLPANLQPSLLLLQGLMAHFLTIRFSVHRSLFQEHCLLHCV